MYTFKENDLVICKPRDGVTDANKDFCVYARVVKVDRENDRLFLDRYIKQGAIKLCGNMDSIYWKANNEGLPLSEVERDELYQLMNSAEVREFGDGIRSGMDNRRLITGIKDPDQWHEHQAQAEETLSLIESVLSNKERHKSDDMER